MVSCTKTQGPWWHLTRLFLIYVIFIHYVVGDSIEYHEAKLRGKGDTPKMCNVGPPPLIPVRPNVGVKVNIPTIQLKTNSPVSKQGLRIKNPLGGLFLPTGINLQLDQSMMPKIKEHLNNAQEMSSADYPVQLYIVNPNKIPRDLHQVGIEKISKPDEDHNRNITNSVNSKRPNSIKHKPELNSNVKNINAKAVSSTAQKISKVKNPKSKLESNNNLTPQPHKNSTQVSNMKKPQLSVIKNFSTRKNQENNKKNQIRDKDVSVLPNISKDLKNVQNNHNNSYETRNANPKESTGTKNIQLVGIIKPAEINKNKEIKNLEIVRTREKNVRDDNVLEVTVNENYYDRESKDRDVLYEQPNDMDYESQLYASQIDQNMVQIDGPESYQQTIESRTSNEDNTYYDNPPIQYPLEDQTTIPNQNLVSKQEYTKSDFDENNLSLVYNQSRKGNELSMIGQNFKIYTKTTPNLIKVNFNHANFARADRIARFNNQQRPLIYRNGYYWNRNSPVYPRYNYYNPNMCRNYIKYTVY